jgi:hypothetical protein
MYIHKLNLAFLYIWNPLIVAVSFLAFIANGWKCFLVSENMNRKGRVRRNPARKSNEYGFITEDAKIAQCDNQDILNVNNQLRKVVQNEEAQKFSSDTISAKIQKYHQNKATEKIKKRNENGWQKIHKEMIDYRKDKQNRKCIPCYIEKDEYENKVAAKMHATLRKSEYPLDGWNQIKE